MSASAIRSVLHPGESEAGASRPELRRSEAPSPRPELEVRNLVKRYSPQSVVGPISFSVAPGEFLSVLGPSGCGKTTTLRCIAGFETPDEGSIVLGGKSIEREPPNRRNIGHVFQSYALFPHLTVASNVAFGLSLRRRPKDEIRRRVAAALDLVGLADLADRYPKQLSGGQQQGVAIARSVGFEEKNNLKITYEFAQDNIRAAKAVSSCSNPVFTTLEAQSLQAVLLAEGGCISGYDLDIVTNYKDVFDAAKEPPRAGLKDFYAPCLLMAYGLTYNSKQIAEPQSYEDLMSPKLKGRIAVPSFDWMGPQFLYSVNAVLGGTPDNLDKGFQFIGDLVKKNDAIMYNNTDTLAQAFAREEVVAAPYWNGRTNTAAKSGQPLKLVYPKGCVATGSGQIITKGTKFPKQANLLVNNFLDPNLQLSLSMAFGYPPSNRKSKLPAGYEFMTIPDTAFQQAAHLDYGKLSTSMAANLERWNKEILG